MPTEELQKSALQDGPEQVAVKVRGGADKQLDVAMTNLVREIGDTVRTLDEMRTRLVEALETEKNGDLGKEFLRSQRIQSAEGMVSSVNKKLNNLVRIVNEFYAKYLVRADLSALLVSIKLSELKRKSRYAEPIEKGNVLTGESLPFEEWPLAERLESYERATLEGLEQMSEDRFHLMVRDMREARAVAAMRDIPTGVKPLVDIVERSPEGSHI